ncbi:serine/threonine-protein kinase AFC3 isoform X1 [Physcomitrium patens]|uniref:serine/threonine-protein kinase AFC3 isoform X1 n=2 Tax=Physcomitrium patens TaxID=3218 RepID=UPI000D174A3A|nr:serine/threonine-protein kinase AFC3-like isoform X1 [Physcomitrium patens]|eukprot:XP_024358870.1 serine/threonine-protein kinase AFC3-like isoform X1 [Physcomitrella patens]
MDRSLYERPEKRARLTLVEDNVSWVDIYDEEHQVAVNSGHFEQMGLGRGVPPAAMGNSPESYNGYPRVYSPVWRDDDKDGHYMFELGENITPRYKIISKKGEGTFGRVLECWDREVQEYVAIKVIRNVQKYRDAAMIEIDVLRTLAKNDKLGTRRCVQLKTWFDYRNHVCIVCERLGPSLYDFLRKNNYRPFFADLVRDFGRQLLESVAYMHELTLIHTDLKPENILLVSSEYLRVPDYKASNTGKHFKRVPKTSEIKLIDFGSAIFDSHYHCSVVSTRHYRAPEVILGLGWTYPCDIWSVGCILVELCSGDALFQTHENLEHLAMMERVLGPIPVHMIKRADRRLEKYFRYGRELNWPEGTVSRESIRAVRRLPSLRNLIMRYVDHSGGLLIDLLQGLLKFEPSERLTAKEALKHPFFKESNRRL